MSAVLLSCQLCLACILLVSSVSKLVSPQQTLAVLAKSFMPKRFISATFIGIIFAELGLGFSFVFHTSQSLTFSFAGTFVILCVFTLWLAIVYIKKYDVSCGCFGTKAKVSLASIARNIILLGLSTLGFFFSFRTQDVLPPIPPGIFLLGTILLGCTIFPVLKGKIKRIQSRENSVLNKSALLHS